MIDACNTLRSLHSSGEFTSEENTAYTDLNALVRRVPCWQRIRGASCERSLTSSE